MIYYYINIENVNSNAQKFLHTIFLLYLKQKNNIILCKMLFFSDFWLIGRSRIRKSKIKLIRTDPDLQHW